ncbi:hypothetical protein V496_07096 [Pseudogymnoascus sp. VKM F-4515 (FW-2607)]|nr:hypothetical protein V496_07096 [Pseudogymnoascus sp. VKM F-4515 (FW-2607)]KFY94879.1 hypothetical protein V498_03663 [Pseudogymnoascus sp. VKM F-4517 (FW-2822)]
MSNLGDKNKVVNAAVDDDEPDEWDKRIFSTGCAAENTKMNDCFYEKKDWRQCKEELENFKLCWKKQSNDKRTSMKDAQSSGLCLLQSSNPTRNARLSGAKRFLSASQVRVATPATGYNRKPTNGEGNGSAPKTNGASKPASIDDQSPINDITSGLADEPLILDEGSRQVDWAKSFHGLSAQPFSKEAADVLLGAIPTDDVEVKPDGIVYLPEIKYRRILNRAFGPGGWGLAPRGETIVTPKSITREYALVAHGRLVSVARGEQAYFSPEGIPTATEGCKSNALMRCCKDLGVASELWDPRFIRRFMKEHAKQLWVEHIPTKKKKQLWYRKDDEPRYPYKENHRYLFRILPEAAPGGVEIKPIRTKKAEDSCPRFNKIIYFALKNNNPTSPKWFQKRFNPPPAVTRVGKAVSVPLKQNVPVAKSMLLSAPAAKPQKKTKSRDLAVHVARDQPAHALVTVPQLRTRLPAALHALVVSVQLMLAHARKLQTAE